MQTLRAEIMSKQYNLTKHEISGDILENCIVEL